MKSTIKLIKKNWLFVLLAALVAILSLFWLLKRSQPEISPDSLPSPTAGTLPQIQSQYSQSLGEGLYYTIFFTEADFNQFPQALPVYQTKPLTQKEITSHYNKLIKGLGLTIDPQEKNRPDGRFLIWQEEKNYLQINLNSGQLLFAGEAPLSLSEETLNPFQVQNLVEEKLLAWQLITEETGIKSLEGFGVAGLELTPVENLNQAIVFQITFTAGFEGYPLIGFGSAKNLIEVKINNQGVLSSLVFNLPQIESQPLDNYPLKSYEETVKEIKEGQGQIIEVLSSQGEERSLPSLKEIQEIRISSVSLAYCVTPETQKHYQPVFLFKGKLITHEGENLPVSIILAAVASSYLQPEQEHFEL